MVVNTKKPAGRRDVNYDSFDELLADAERLHRVSWSQPAKRRIPQPAAA
jgi:hypothetical protein